MGTYFVLMTSIFVNVYIISAIGDRLKEEVDLTEQFLYYIILYNTYSFAQLKNKYCKYEKKVEVFRS